MSSNRKPLVRDTFVPSVGPSSSARCAIRVHDDVEDDAPTLRVVPAPPTERATGTPPPEAQPSPKVGSQRPTLRSATNPHLVRKSTTEAGDEQNEKPPTPSRRYYPIRIAAPRMHLSEGALRIRCQRNAKRVGDRVIADLGGGFIAVKVGSRWFVHLPDLEK